MSICGGIPAKKEGRKTGPDTGIIGSRSVKTSHHTNQVKGTGGGKKVKGRKQHIITDTMGLLLCVAVHAANTHDGKGAMEAIKLLQYKFSRLVKIIDGGGYRGELIDNVKHAFGWILEIVMRTDSNSKFAILPKRWIVERTFARFENYKRLAIDYEFNTHSSEAMIHLAMIKLMLNRIY
jgi:putative transposase